MADQEGHRPPLASPAEFNSEGDISNMKTEPAAAGTGLPSPGIRVDFHGDPTEERPPLAAHLSAPAAEPKFQSPVRHHKRAPSIHREVKETLNARSEYTNDEQDGSSHHIINQYVIKEEIGRGSYGAVHLATDQFGNEYAVKEFSKARLRKRAQSNILRLGPRGPGGRLPLRPGSGLGAHRSARLNDQQSSEAKDSLFLIREEIAIMKKLNHPNLVSLIEVLDDPEEDSLYMVLEMCKKGVVMKVGLDDPADPYPPETCRCWFRDLILGIEYLHVQGVVHRDIKPDNLLLTEDDVLKIVDFGVSEMFDKPDNMRTAKSAGSPAFLPPELCVGKHGDVSGKSTDIWSMGVSLYCLHYGRLPFERSGVLDMYEAIRNETPKFPEGEDPDFVDMMTRILEKDPEERITMQELREHPWVTKGGQDPMMNTEENCADPVEMPNALEVNHAFTRRMSHLLCVMKAISKFKSLLTPKGVITKPYEPNSSSLETDGAQQEQQEPKSSDSDSTLVPPGKPTESEPEKAMSAAEHAAHIIRQRELFLKDSGAAPNKSTGEKGHAHDPTDSDPPFLGIGTGGHDGFSSAEEAPPDMVSDSPTAVDFNVYDRAFDAEVDKIKRSTSRKGSVKGRRGTGKMYHTKHLKDEKYKDDDLVNWAGEGDGAEGEKKTANESIKEKFKVFAPRSGPKFADLVAGAVKDAKSKVEEVAGVSQEGVKLEEPSDKPSAG